MKFGIYNKVEALDKKKDQSLRVNPLEDFGYAEDLANCGITLNEFMEAKKSFPIVFVKNEAGYSAIGMLGLDGKNVFISEKDKTWKQDSYIPAFVRRYPFIFISQGDKLTLALDKDCKAINKKSGKLIFDKDGEATESTKGVMNFMEAYQKDANITSQIIAEFDKIGILEEVQLNMGEGEDSKIFKGFMRVNEEKLNALDDKMLLGMVKNGIYKLILAHLESLDNFKFIAK